MGDDLRPVNAARISFGKQKDKLDDKDLKLLKYLADNQHMTPFEANVLTVIIECPLYIRSQIHRHRTMSFNEISRRYTAENIEFYIPPIDDFREQSKNNKQASEGSLDLTRAKTMYAAFYAHCQRSLQLYEDLLKNGLSREQARAVLPQNLMTKFYMTGNLRNFVHFLKLRLDPHAQKEVRIIAEQIKQILQDKFPESTKVLLND